MGTIDAILELIEEDPYCKCGHFRSSHYRIFGARTQPLGLYPTGALGAACVHCDCQLHEDES